MALEREFLLPVPKEHEWKITHGLLVLLVAVCIMWFVRERLRVVRTGALKLNGGSIATGDPACV